MSLVFVDQVAALFRTYMDENDQSFVSDANVATYLQQGEADYREFVNRLDPSVFSVRVLIPAATRRFYDLSDIANPVVVMGEGPLTHTRASAVVSLYLLGNNNDLNHVTHVFRPVSSMNELRRGFNSYYLDGPVIRFSNERDDAYGLEYTPVTTVDWTQQTPGDDEFIDDLTQYHDVIALMAYSHYAIRDAADNQQLVRALALRMQELEKFIRNRGQSEPQFVNDIYGGLWEPDDMGY